MFKKSGIVCDRYFPAVMFGPVKYWKPSGSLIAVKTKSESRMCTALVVQTFDVAFVDKIPFGPKHKRQSANSSSGTQSRQHKRNFPLPSTANVLAS